MSCGIPFTEGTHVRILIEISMKYRALYSAIEDTAIRIQSLKSLYIDGITTSLPIVRCAYVELIVLAAVFSMTWYTLVMQQFLVIYSVTSHLSLVFSWITQELLTVYSISIFRIVYKDFMRHFVLNLKAQDGNSLARPKLQPTRVPVSCFFLKTPAKPSNV